MADAETLNPDLATAPPAPKRRGTLLVVDDEEGPRMAIKVIFRDAYDLLIAEDGVKAIELAKHNDIDVAVLDIRMAGMSGIEVLEQLRQVRPDLEAIMITAFETTDTIRQALRLRACDYINKPFDVGTIRNAVAQAMQRRTLQNSSRGGTEKVQEILTELQNEKVEGQIARAHKDIYASILHDINGPLSVGFGFMQLLEQKHAKLANYPAEDLKRERIIIRQLSSCIEIQRRYLGFLRRQNTDQAHTGVNQLLKDLEQLVRVHPSLQENEFALHPLASEINVRMNGTDVIQILLNLTVNALQCTPLPHRVEISSEALTAPLDLTQFKDGANDRFLNVESMHNAAPLVKLAVRDNGPGIPSEILPKIFQSYFTTKGQGQGTGLGLSIVQRLVKDAQGALHVHTRRGEGTIFTLYLPGSNLG
jgi:two-component system, sensor histidine kinase and response regulator